MMNYVVIDEERCKGCGLCINACPKKVLSFSKKFNSKGYHPAQQHDRQLYRLWLLLYDVS